MPKNIIRVLFVSVLLAIVLIAGASVVSAQGTVNPPPGWCTDPMPWIIDGVSQTITADEPCANPSLVDVVQLWGGDESAPYPDGALFGDPDLGGKLTNVPWADAVKIFRHYEGGSIWRVGDNPALMFNAQVVAADELLCDYKAGAKMLVNVPQGSTLNVRNATSSTAGAVGVFEPGYRFQAFGNSTVVNGECWLPVAANQYVLATMSNNVQLVIADPFFAGVQYISYGDAELPKLLLDNVQDTTWIGVYEAWTAGCDSNPGNRLCNEELNLVMQFADWDDFVKQGAVGVTLPPVYLEDGIMWENGSVGLMVPQGAKVTASTPKFPVMHAGAASDGQIAAGETVEVIGVAAEATNYLLVFYKDALTYVIARDVNIDTKDLRVVTRYQPVIPAAPAEGTPEATPPVGN